MERKRKKINLKFIVLILSLIVFLSMSVLTFAWFTDSKSFTGDLTFGSLELDVSGGVSGDGVDSATSKLVFDVARQKAGDSTWTGKIMPGDTIDINLTVGLKSGSEPAYYLIFIHDDKGVFENNVYFSDGTKTGNVLNVYVNDGTKTYLQTDSTMASVTNKYCGKLTAGTPQNIKISAKVAESYTEQNTVCNVTCTIGAIQQANLKESDAKYNLNVKYGTNLLPLKTTKETYSNYGLSITVNGDGTFTLDGEVSGESVFIFDINNGAMDITTDGVYLLTGFLETSTVTNSYLQPYINKISQGVLIKGVVEYSWKAGDTLSFVRFFIRTGISFDNFTFAPRLVKKI